MLFSFVAAVLLALIAYTLFFTGSVYRSANRILAILFLSFAVNMLSLTLRFSGERIDAYLLNVIIGLSIGPIIYIYVSTVLRRITSLSSKNLVHFIPVAFIALVDIAGLKLSNFKDLFILLSMTGYLVAGVRLFVKHRKTQVIQNEATKYLHYFIQLLFAFVFILIVIDLLVYFEYSQIGITEQSLTLSIAVILFAALSLVFTSASLNRLKFIEWMFSSKYALAINNDIYSIEQKSAMMEKMTHLMDSQRLYLEDACSIDDLAIKLTVPARLISQTINQIYGKSFRRYINDLRIAEAKRLLIETQEPIMNIMFDVGFNTKSNFNKEFFQTVGMSPNEYRKSKATQTQ
jgi:AraC-like DNA-binding protein